MTDEILHHLSQWQALDTWIVITAALAAMACALPGNYLFLRRQSMMGDALSHTVLLGLVTAFLLMHVLEVHGWISRTSSAIWEPTVMAVGAIVVGVLTAILTESLRKLGGVEGSAALGVVYTTFFALGLLLVRLYADSVHIDAQCVLYGTIETVVLDTLPGTSIPREAVTNGAMLAINGVLVILFFKELQIAAFDPDLSRAMGIPAGVIHYALMCVTAITLVAAFKSVGSILVVAMLIVPAATANLLTHRLPTMIVLSLVIAAASAVLGHAMALALPPIVGRWLGFPMIVDASTAGMMSAAAGLLFVAALVFSPRSGWIRMLFDRLSLQLRIVQEDLLGALYRIEEQTEAAASRPTARAILQVSSTGWLIGRAALRRLVSQGLVREEGGVYSLTDAGRQLGGDLVRSHRLFESYMAKHFAVRDDHLHPAAARVEHYIDADLQREMATDLDRPAQDPHGKQIPQA
jgi:manganese/zinc/iron transport system permease protein